jgi:DNA-binding MarR family transcriptional regulator
MHRTILWKLLRAAHRTDVLVNRILLFFETSSRQFLILDALVHHHGAGLALTDLALHIGCTPAAVTEPVKRLADHGYVTIAPHAQDARVRFVQATQRGRNLQEEMWHYVKGWLDDILRDLSETDRVVLARCLDAVERGSRLTHNEWVREITAAKPRKPLLYDPDRL